MKNFTLTESNPVYTLYQNQRFLSVTVSGSTFGDRQLLIEERDDTGTWSLAHGAPILASDHDGFTIASKVVGQRLRFKATGSGACNIVIATDETPVITNQFIATGGGGTAIEAEQQEARDYLEGELFYFGGLLWRVSADAPEGETPTTNPEKFELIGGENLEPQTATLTAGVIAYDVSSGSNAALLLDADATALTLTNAATGDSGLIEITQDATGGHVVNLTAGELVLAGDLADLAAITPTTGVATLGWYKHDNGANDVYLYVSSAT